MTAFDPSRIITKVPKKQPITLLYSQHGVGKGAFIASADNPFVIDMEMKFKTDYSASIYQPEDYEDLLGCLDGLLNQDSLPYGIVALDTLDWMEKAVHSEICIKYNVETINDDHCKTLNFNKGSILAANMFFSNIFTKLAEIRIKHNIPIVITAHCLETKKKPADSAEYYANDIRVDKWLAACVSDLVDAKLYLRIQKIYDQNGKMIPTLEREIIPIDIQGVQAKNNLHILNFVPISELYGWDEYIKAIEYGEANKPKKETTTTPTT